MRYAVLALLVAVIIAISLPAEIFAGEVSPPAKPETPGAKESAEKPAQPEKEAGNTEKANPSLVDEEGRIRWSADAGEREARKSEPSDQSMFGVILNIVMWVALLSLIFIGGMWLMRKMVPGSRKLFGSRLVNVLGRTHLSSKHAVYLLKVGDKVLVVGVAGDRIQPLSEVTDPREVARMTSEGTPPPAERSGKSFLNVFSRNKQNYSPQSSPEPVTGMGEAKEEIDRIRNMVSSWKDRYREASDV